MSPASSSGWTVEACSPCCVNDNMKKAALILCFLLFLLMSGFGVYLWTGGLFAFFPELAGLWQEQTVVANGTSEYRICTDTDDRLCEAAAAALARELYRATGAALPVAAEAEEGQPVIRLTIEAAPPEAESPCALTMEENGLALHLYDREQALALVQGFCALWLSEEGGLCEGPSLLVDTGMLQRLSTAEPLALRPVRILTQNLRYCDDPDGNSVAERSVRFLELVNDCDPDLIGAQEVTDAWLFTFLNRFADRYAVYGYPRGDKDAAAVEWNAILFRRDRFECIGGSTFWLSETPEAVGSKLDYPGGHPRICTWVLLRELETGKTFLFANTHLQNGAVDKYGAYREEQLRILFDVLRGGSNVLESYPGFLVGDFNGTEKEAFYRLAASVYRDARKTAIEDRSRINFTFHNYGKAHYAILDYCFHSPTGVTVLDYQILDKDYGGYVSDHYGVLIDALLD